MRRFLTTLMAFSVLCSGALFTTHAPAAVGQGFRGISFSTPYPAQTLRAGEPVSITLTVRNHGLPPQIVSLQVVQAPRGWTVTFLGAGRPIRSVFVDPNQETTVTARLEPPAGAASGTFRFVLAAQGQAGRASLPLTLSLGEVLPPKLDLNVELPILRGLATSTFRYRLALKNDSDQDLLVSLQAQAPRGFQVSFTPSLAAQQVTSLPLKAGESRDIDTEVILPRDAPAGMYEVMVTASGGEARVQTTLGLEVTGRPELLLSGPEGRLSGRAVAGRATPFKLTVRNGGSASAERVELSASEPTGWEVSFDPRQIMALAPRQEREVVASIRPSPRAVAGDYIVTMRAAGGEASASADVRITVHTSTLWGVIGIVLVAFALAVVSLAVSRYGRR